MEYFMIACLVVVALFGLSLIVCTVCMGTELFIGLQVLMGSLSYSKEVDDKLQLELAKIDAGLCDVEVTQHRISLYNKLEPDETPNTSRGEFYYRESYISIWVENKFYSYGYICDTNGVTRSNYSGKRPSVAVIKRILQLQKSGGDRTTKKTKVNKEEEKTVILG